jgi:hypothetical protein
MWRQDKIITNRKVIIVRRDDGRVLDCGRFTVLFASTADAGQRLGQSPGLKITNNEEEPQYGRISG